MSQQPRSVTHAVRLLLGVIALGALTSALMVAQRDELIAAWSVGHPVDSSIQPPAFVTPVIVLYVVMAGLLLVLMQFLTAGHNWARYSLAGTVFLLAIAALAGLRTELPVLFFLCLMVSILLDVVLLFFLMHRDTTAFLRGERAITPES